MTETILMTAAGSALAALGGRVLWDRWRAPERVARQVSREFVSRAECDRCLSGTQQRLQTLEAGLVEFRRENREDHRALFEEVRRLNGRGG